MAVSSLDTLSNVLHILYARFLTSQTNDYTHVRDLIEKDSQRFEGSVYKMGLVDGYPVTGGPRGPGATIPDATSSDAQQSDIFLTYHYYPIEIDWDVEEQSSGSHAWIRASALEIERVRRWSLKRFEMQMMLDGSGIIAGIPAVSATNDLPRVNVTSITPAVTFEVRREYGIRFERGMRIEFWKSAGAAFGEATVKRAGPSGSQTYYTVATIVHSSSTLKTTVTCVESAPGGPGVQNDPGDDQGSAQYDYISIEGSIMSFDFGLGAVNGGNDVPGIKAWINTGAPPIRTTTKNNKPAASTFQGLSPASYGYWNATEIDAQNGPPGPKVFEDVSETMEMLASEPIDGIGFFLMHPKSLSKFRRTLYPFERFTVTGETAPSFPTGTASATAPKRKYLTWGGIPLIPTRYCDPDRMYGLNRAYARIIESTPFKFATGDGAMWHRSPTGKASYRAVAYKYEGAGVNSRQVHVVVKNLDVTDT